MSTANHPANAGFTTNAPRQTRSRTVLVIALAAVALIALFGDTASTENDWYEGIRPAITPPDFVFPIVWTILYAFIAVSIYLAWNDAGTSKRRWTVGLLFVLNLLANAAWTPLFFGLRMPALALADLVIVWITAIVLAVYLWPVNKGASALLWPYVAWAAFAGVINFMIVIG